jgi:urease accessory protein
MSAVTLRHEVPEPSSIAASPARLQRGDGAAEIVFAARGLAHLYQRTPCRVLFPMPEPGDLPVAALLTTSGGLAGGDRLNISIAASAGARAIATTAAAEKIYRSLGPDSRIDIKLTVEEGGWLEYLPQETILFDGARLQRHCIADLAPGGNLLAAEMVVFGRTARGERFTRGLLHDAWRIRVGGKLVWADALRLDGNIAGKLDAPAGFAGATALATAIYGGSAAGDLLPFARELAAEGDCRGGVTLVNGILVARFLNPRADTVRRALARHIASLRNAAAGLPAGLPRLWQSEGAKT